MYSTDRPFKQHEQFLQNESKLSKKVGVKFLFGIRELVSVEVHSIGNDKDLMNVSVVVARCSASALVLTTRLSC